MFKIVVADTNFFKDSISTIAELIDEGIFKVNKDGLSLMAADRAMVAVVDFKMLPTAFEEFDVDKEYNMAVNIPNFVSFLKRASGRDKIILELKENKLYIILKNASTRRFILPLLDISEEEIPPIDQLEFKAEAEISAEILKNGIEDAEVVADSIVFEATPTTFSLKAEGDISSAQLSLEKDNKALANLKSIETIRARYPLDYLKKMIKASKIADIAYIRWSKDYPMRIDFIAKDKGQISFVVAPRVQEE